MTGKKRELAWHKVCTHELLKNIGEKRRERQPNEMIIIILKENDDSF